MLSALHQSTRCADIAGGMYRIEGFEVSSSTGGAIGRLYYQEIATPARTFIGRSGVVWSRVPRMTGLPSAKRLSDWLVRLSIASEASMLRHFQLPFMPTTA